MKKIISCILILTLALGLLAACSGGDEDGTWTGAPVDNAGSTATEDKTENTTSEPETETKKSTIVPVKDIYNAMVGMFPEIKDWILADEFDDTKVYTNNGSATNYSGMVMIADDTVTLSKDQGKILVMYNVDPSINEADITVSVQNRALSLEQSIGLAARILQNRENALSTSTLLSRLSSSSVTKGNHYYQETVNGIRYFLTAANDGSRDNILISFGR